MTSPRFVAPASRRSGWLLLAALCLGRASPGGAIDVEDVPNPRARGAWVSDLADVISGAEETLINGVVDALERDNGAEIAVVTLAQLRGRTPKDFAHELFNRWGVGKEGADNGVLVLLVLDPRRVEVETGYGAEGVLPDGEVGAILDRHAVPAFKGGMYGEGLRATVEALARELRKGEPATSRVARSVGLSREVLLTILAALIFLGVAIFVVYVATRPTRCRRCEKPMRLLTSAQERAYLSQDEQFEQRLGSVDHKVWRCDACREHTITAHGKWFSGYATCSACDRKTAQESTRTLSHATYDHGGLEEVTVRCRLPRCRHVHSYTRSTPRLTRPSSSSSSSWSSSSSSSWSSSSSSFGGGSSGGGGAGRSW